jgi:two-component system, OmpR family, phosphate regulon sensor histidine kinase PhoR
MTQSQPKKRQPWFISWRWRIVVPMTAAVMLVAMLGAYFVAVRASDGLRILQDDILLESVRGVVSRTDAFYERHYQEAQRMAFTVGVPEAVADSEEEILTETIEALARLGDLDSVILTDTNGIEVLGVQWVAEANDYAVNSGTNLSEQAVVRQALAGNAGTAGYLRTPEGILMFVGVPLQVDGGVVGSVLVGVELADVMTTLKGSAVTDVALYDDDGALLQTTFPLNDQTRPDLAVNTSLMGQTLGTDGRAVPIQSQTISRVPHRAAYLPVNMGDSTLGIAGIFVPNNIPATTIVTRQLNGLMAAGIAGAAVVMVFVGLFFFTERVERVQKTAEALARGNTAARTRMKATDEAGAAGAALDAFANRVQHERDAMQQTLNRQRREANHLTAVLESLPDGVIVQDNNGQMTFINNAARQLLATSRQPLAELLRPFESQQAHGEPLAPGMYALGNPQQVNVGGKMLNAQAASIMTMNGERVGTVLVLRDMTEYVQQEQQRERLLRAVEEEIHAPLAELAQASALSGQPLGDFAKEITKRAVALQKLVVEMRELTEVDDEAVRQRQKVLPLDTLIWTVANDWRQIAQAAEITLRVTIQRPGLHILGDERRLRWAVGNILDNAIKYTPPGGTVTLEINGESKGQAMMRVRDSGVGIADQDLPHVTTRFYRGNPTTQTGEIIRTPGMGQGLHTAEQIFSVHGGFLRVRSQVGAGTAVYFSVPVTSTQTLDLPRIVEDFEGETVKLPEGQMRDLNL